MTVKELRKILKSFEPDALVLDRADMQGYDRVHGVDGFLVIKTRNPGNGTGEFKTASKTTKRKKVSAVILHCDPNEGKLIDVEAIEI